jgi:hypothetical protein
VQPIASLAGPFSVDLLRLHSPAPDPVAVAATPAGTVANPGRVGTSSLTGVRLSGVTRPTWVVLGESFDQGWKATCDGRSLGAPRPIDGYANGFLVPTGCQRVAFHFGPQSEAIAGYIASALICATLVLFLLIGWRFIRRDRTEPVLEGPVLADPRVRALSLPRAVLVAIPVAAVVGVMFALRAGAGAYPLLVLVLWRGFQPRTLVLAAAGLLGIAVPLDYLLRNVPNQGGYNFQYSLDVIVAHWIALAAIILLLFAGLHMVRGARAARRGEAARRARV